MQDLVKIKSDFETALKAAEASAGLEDLRVAYLGKKGSITELMKQMASLSPEQKKEFGAKINELKNFVASELDSKKQQIEAKELSEKLSKESIDITLPIREEQKGRIHPITQVIEEITAILSAQGFSVAEGPDIEDDYNNFGALNIPEEHPARQMHDTFYMPGTKDGKKLVLRTHTSPVQVHTMLNEKPPIRIIAPGRTYRSDSDITHSPMFHQVEGLYIDKNVNMAQLKNCLIEFLKSFFGIADLPIRFRPSFFPFTEPSAEVDIGCERKGGELKIGAGKDWLEVLGCGMVHPNVLKNCNIDPNEYSGFAFGMGVERLAMLKYNIPDLRTFYESDIRWLEHYGFAALDIPNLMKGI